MENSFKEKVSDALSPKARELAQGRSLHLLRINVRGTEQNPVIEVILDGDRGIKVEDCESVSRDLNQAIETEMLIKGNYRLDVLSPGTEEPVVHEWQFQRNVGRLVEVHYEDSGESHTLHGHLREFDLEWLSIEPIHVKGKKASGPKIVETEEGEAVRLKVDEQIYTAPVTLVRIERKHVTKVLVQVEFNK